MLELCEADGIQYAERDLSTTDLYGANEMFCTGTMGELVPVTGVDGRRIADGKTGPMTQKLMTLFRRAVAEGGEPVL